MYFLIVVTKSPAKATLERKGVVHDGRKAMVAGYIASTIRKQEETSDAVQFSFSSVLVSLGPHPREWCYPYNRVAFHFNEPSLEVPLYTCLQV